MKICKKDDGSFEFKWKEWELNSIDQIAFYDQNGDETRRLKHNIPVSLNVPKETRYYLVYRGSSAIVYEIDSIIKTGEKRSLISAGKNTPRYIIEDFNIPGELKEVLLTCCLPAPGWSKDCYV